MNGLQWIRRNRGIGICYTFVSVGTHGALWEENPLRKVKSRFKKLLFAAR